MFDHSLLILKISLFASMEYVFMKIKIALSGGGCYLNCKVLL